MSRTGPRRTRGLPRTQTYSQAVEAFMKASPWITAMHAPAIASLRHLAADLDDGAGIASVAQFNLCYRNLAKLAPGPEPESDPVDELLSQARTS